MRDGRGFGGRWRPDLYLGRRESVRLACGEFRRGRGERFDFDRTAAYSYGGFLLHLWAGVSRLVNRWWGVRPGWRTRRSAIAATALKLGLQFVNLGSHLRVWTQQAFVAVR